MLTARLAPLAALLGLLIEAGAAVLLFLHLVGARLQLWLTVGGLDILWLCMTQVNTKAWLAVGGMHLLAAVVAVEGFHEGRFAAAGRWHAIVAAWMDAACVGARARFSASVGSRCVRGRVAGFGDARPTSPAVRVLYGLGPRQRSSPVGGAGFTNRHLHAASLRRSYSP